MDVLPGYTFTGPTDPITYAKLNLLGQPTVTIGANEIVTANIANYSVTPIKLSQQTGGGFLGRTASTLGDISFVQLSDGSITWPTNGIAIGKAATESEFTMGLSNTNRVKITWLYPLARMETYVGGPTASNILYGNGNAYWTAGNYIFHIGDGSSARVAKFSITSNADVKLGPDSSGVVPTTSINGFLFPSNCAGTPTGVPEGSGTPLVIDTTANKIWVYSSGSWKYAQLT